ncbi:MBL fold metallo-hydrolase RNA specificity domain-containing protein [Acidithiobacillus caldus]
MVRLFADQSPTHERLHTIDGFSAHADQRESLAWQQALRPTRVIIVHGDHEPGR